ncbi:hypothetical protein HK102_000438, partial [Quaeritorhiza haematococci]
MASRATTSTSSPTPQPAISPTTPPEEVSRLKTALIISGVLYLFGAFTVVVSLIWIAQNIYGFALCGRPRRAPSWRKTPVNTWLTI